MKTILFLMSDTGGGHRAAAKAIMRAIDSLAPGGQVTMEMVDFIQETFLPPFNHGGGIYSPMVNRADWLWGLGFRLSRPRPVRALANVFEMALSSIAMRRLFRQLRPALVVSVHPLATSWSCRLVHRLLPGSPFVTVVTDLATGHPFWFSRCADLTIVPSEEARANALHEGVLPATVEVHGLPIDLRFASLPDPAEAAALKARFGAAAEKPLVLLVGGGEGMGRLEEHAEAVAGAGLDLTLMVIAGRNEALRERLSQRHWPIPVIVTGFVNDMPERMVAADAIVTKAGPGTLSEAFAAGLPVLITGFVPGQEEGNVTWAVSSGAGRETRDRATIQAALRDLFPGSRAGERHAAMRAAALRIAHPEAALTIARRLLALIGTPTT